MLNDFWASTFSGTSIVPILWYNTGDVDVTSSGYVVSSDGAFSSSSANPWTQVVGNSSFDVTFDISTVNIYAGVAKSTKIGTDYTDIDFCCHIIYVDSTGYVMYYYNNGVNVGFTILSDIGLPIRMYVVGGVCKVDYNGMNVYSFAAVVDAVDFKIKASFVDPGLINILTIESI